MGLWTVLCICAMTVINGSDLRLETPLLCGSSDQQLFHYDDGTASWLTWSGQWRGVWFDLDDFSGFGNSLICDYTQFWFYHHSSYGWDTSLFYAELWTGESVSPSQLLSQDFVVATHYSANYAVYDPPIDCGNSLWVFVNTAFSSGGWPASLGDGTEQPTENHSFFSNDFELWEPWIVDGTNANDFLIRVHGSFLSLEASTWAGIKTILR
ncbi:MAG: hypothetical protein J7K88_05115 [Candidatus Fermentibacteraceae bacterium]|nr:hypothetical protein [Candidatus Fermentibacteraceae bacterium]